MLYENRYIAPFYNGTGLPTVCNAHCSCFVVFDCDLLPIDFNSFPEKVSNLLVSHVWAAVFNADNSYE